MMINKGNDMKAKFLNAKDGTVEVTMDNNDVHVFTTSEEMAEFIRESGMDVLEDVYASSSMDFASEYGFQTDSGAWEMVENALESV